MEEMILEKTNIENMIYEIRGKQVMLDSDLARIYQYSQGTKALNQAVKRHKERFPKDFYFQLTVLEYKEILRSQVVTLKLEGTDNIVRKYLPYAFTEQGVAMLATILRTQVATQVSINIMRAFVELKKYASQNLLEQKYINNQVLKNTEDIRLLQESFQKFEEKKIVNEIYFNGQIYDAYSKILDIVQEAKKELVIIDGYADKMILDIIRHLNCSVFLITKTNNTEIKNHMIKYVKQYHNLKITYNDTFHDRYFLIDDTKIYHCGTSINYAGSRTFSINLLEDEVVKRKPSSKSKQDNRKIDCIL